MLQGGTGEPLIHYLHDHHIPFIVVSGFAFKMRGRVHAPQVLEKPVAGTRVLRALSQAIGDQAASASFRHSLRPLLAAAQIMHGVNALRGEPCTTSSSHLTTAPPVIWASSVMTRFKGSRRCARTGERTPRLSTPAVNHFPGQRPAPSDIATNSRPRSLGHHGATARPRRCGQSSSASICGDGR